MKVYEAVFKEGETEGIFGIGLVYNPAMEDMFVALNEEEVKLSMIEDKRMVFGAVLIPDKDVLRVDGSGNPFAMRFSAETIEKLAHDWVEKSSHKNFTEQHENPVQGVTAVEMWTVKDPERDTSNYFGKKYPKGTLVAMSKVNNDKIWSDIKEGKINGYSIEALLGLSIVELNNNNKMTKQDFLKELNNIFTFDKVEDKPEQIEVKSEEVATEVATPDVEPEIEAKEEETVDNSVLDAITELKTQFEKQIEDLRVELSEKEEVIKEKEEEVEEIKTELEKQPEVKPIKAQPEVKEETEFVSTAKSIKARALENLSKLG